MLCWVFVSVLGPSPVVASGGHSSSRCAGLSPSRPLLLRSTAPDAQAQQPWLTGPAAPRHVGSSQTRARTRVPRISRQTPNHCATREALFFIFKNLGNSLVVQWLGLGTFTASWAPGLIPGQGTKIPRAEWRSQKKKKKINRHLFL